ncbi:hypothetical protein P5667_01205 [Bacillus velezensis]|uniref:hypothetical protein n=1 Tax=Bacillus subtilis group TaxID=653685 RepID=UPI0013627F53|nr:hypothetical protein [Bacillus velezensis]MCE4939280.1 hypothetical protein [Bacillus velezensis]MDH3073999.1 hypothetical protein [Bacillus velezensis]MDH3084954.1 hypothetical protein [Bacillus velezensis]MDH3105616.1 hypothetical protein [Bacillus velezensis]MDH3137129.1 hypothetical protein [Bacillus velezensis]
MCYYNAERFATFMSLQFGIDVDEEQVGEESVLLYKEELDENLVTEELLSISPEMVLVHSCVYNKDEHEWLVCVASNADTNQPLFLICLKNGEKIHEKVLLRDKENEK